MALTPITQANIYTARTLWYQNNQLCLTTYGHMSNWDVSSCTNMQSLFSEYYYVVPDISGWNVGNVTNMGSMFNESRFNGDISKWNVGNVTNMGSMFRLAREFKGDISLWNVGNVTNMNRMFYQAISFNADISQWNVGNVTDMGEMFGQAEIFNADISRWNVGNVTNMGGMFRETYVFNADISGWNVGNVTNMASMFYLAENFNADISRWNVGKVTSMVNTFRDAPKFNADISRWNVEKVTSMENMFRDARKFNADISGWNVGNVTNMRFMFFAYSERAFNADIGKWNVGNVTDMYNFLGPYIAYGKDLSKWDVRKNPNHQNFSIDAPQISPQWGTWPLLLTFPSMSVQYNENIKTVDLTEKVSWDASINSIRVDSVKFSGIGVSGTILRYTDVSSYTVVATQSYINYNDVSASAIFTITKANQPTTFYFSSSSYSVQYNPSSKTVDLSGRTIGGLPAATITFSGTGVSGTTLTYTDVSSYIVRATKTYANYNDVSASTIITITNATQPTFDFASSAYSVQYTSSKTVDLTGRTTGGLPEATITFSGTGVSGNILTYTDVSSYTVYATKTFANYDDVSASSIITITNATQPTFGFSSSTYFVKYDPLSMTVDLSGKTIGGLPEAALTFSGTGVSGSILTYTGTGNYTVNATKMYANYHNVSSSSTIIITGLSVSEQRKATKTMVSNLSVTQSLSARLIIPKAEILGFDFKQKTSVLVVQPSTTITKMDMRDHAVYSLLENTGDQITFPSRTSEVTVKNIGNDQFELKNAGTTFATLTSGESTVFDHLTLSVGSVLAELDPLIILCFKRDTKILCLCQKTCKEIYMKIQELTPGTLVKTFKHGFVPISTIGYRNLHNSGDSVRTRNRLYECSVKDYPELFENLVITGCHSILEDIVSQALQKELETENGGQLYTTDGKCRVMAFMDKRTKPYPKKGAFEIWHFSLEHDDEYKNYGVYANGLLVETASKRMMKDYSDMTLITAK